MKAYPEAAFGNRFPNTTIPRGFPAALGIGRRRLGSGPFTGLVNLVAQSLAPGGRQAFCTLG